MYLRKMLFTGVVAGTVLVGACSPAHEAGPIVRPEVSGVQVDQVHVTSVPESYETTGTVVPRFVR